MVRASLFVAALCLNPCLLAAAKPVLPRQYVLGRFEDSSRECTSFTATVDRLQCDWFSEAPLHTRGRVRWELGVRAYYVTSGCALRWQNGDLMFGRNRLAHADLQAARKRLFDVDAPPGIWERFSLWPAFYAEFEDVLPLLFLPDARAAVERFDITTSNHADGILVTATPKRRPDAMRWNRIDLILDPVTFHPTAHRIRHTRPFGGETVHLFEHVQINEPDDIIPQLLKSAR